MSPLPARYSALTSALRALGRAVSAAGIRCARAVFGDVRWQAPAWATAAGRTVRAATTLARAHPRRAAAWAGGTVLAIAAAGAAAWWLHQRPKPAKPVEVALQVAAPGRTRLEDEGARPEPLKVTFSQPVARIEQAGKPVTAGIGIDPRVDGAWRWEGDRMLVFEPRNDWPIGTEYTVTLDPKVIVTPPRVLKAQTFRFRTAAFGLAFADARLHQDPTQPALRKVVATVNFTHPADPAEFEKRVVLRQPHQRAGVLGIGAEATKFSVTWDKLRLNAHIHSEPLPIPKDDSQLTVAIEPGVRAARGGPALAGRTERGVALPGLYSLRIENAALVLVRNERHEPEQVLTLETSAEVGEKDIRGSIEAWVLPVYHPATKPEERKTPHAWSNTAEVGPEVLKAATPLKLAPIATEREWSSLHSFRYRADTGRHVYVRVAKGLRSFGGYELGRPWNASLVVPEFPKELRILAEGSLLSLSGERKVSLLVRDVPTVEVEIGRVLPGQIHHLLTQSTGRFGQPRFRNAWTFSAANLTERMTETLEIPKLPAGRAHYHGFDLTKYLGTGTDGRRGLFLLRVKPRDAEPPKPKARLQRDEQQERDEAANDEPGENESADEPGQGDGRLILVTDLGLLAKKALDGSYDVFAQSVANGEPMAGTTIDVVGRNGIAVLSATTDATGHARVPSLRDFRNEQQPVLFLARRGADLSFLPIGRSDRMLDVSRFDVGGVANAWRPESLTAYLFSDRGIYRPGDEMRVGLIVRAADWTRSLAGVPLEAVITDARGLVVRREPLRLPAGGFTELRHATQETSPTGTWNVSLHLVRDGETDTQLGAVDVKVQEFLPDRMKMGVRLGRTGAQGWTTLVAREGWLTPDQLKARVELMNLTGTPAENRRVTAELTLSPAWPAFAAWPGYQFHDPQRAKEGVRETLAEATTAADGTAVLDLGLERYARATYRLHLVTRGFEAGGGRSVAAETAQLVSSMPYLVGYKADGDLGYVHKDSKREVELVAIGPDGKRRAADGLRVVHVERRFVSVLAKQGNGTYRYDSVRREQRLDEKPLDLGVAGAKVALPTAQPGTFALAILDAGGLELNRIEYGVAGHANLTRSLEKNAELAIQLDRRDYAPGDTIELAIRAPYTGAGLITIERDRVYRHQWFRTDRTASVQKIRLPEGLEGNGYVAVSFVRDLNSPEVFASPLSHGVVPFSVNLDRRRVALEVSAPDLAKPGEPLRMSVRSDRPTRAVVFAIDEGILQVAGYRTPDPLGHFFQKRMLDVKTTQILDLILPEFRRLMQAAAPGGDAEGALGKHLNPFRRKRDVPVAYWSGIVEIGPKARELSYDVPATFNGSIRVMAVAVAPDAIGVAQRRATIRGDFVLSPNAPTTVAPGDEFEVSVGVANNVAGSGPKAKIAVSLVPSPHLALVGAARTELEIGELRESVTTFRLRAGDRLGSATLAFEARLGSRATKLSTDLSVRPAVPYMTTLAAGYTGRGTIEVPAPRVMHAEHRKLEASVSVLPLAVAHGLVGYLNDYPYGCTEQITSQTFPAIVLRGRPGFDAPKVTPEQALAHTIATLRARQNAEGGFGLWAANHHVSEFASVYAMHLLIEARERGMTVPQDLVESGNRFLRKLAATPGRTLDDERLRAYAIYLVTRQGVVTSTFVASLHQRLEGRPAAEKNARPWQQDLAAAYLAASYRLMKQDRLAGQLISGLRIGEGKRGPFRHYYDDVVHDAQVLALIARHFPERLAGLDDGVLDHLVTPIQRGYFHTLSASYTVLALDAYATAAGTGTTAKFSLAERLKNDEVRPLPLPGGLFPRVPFSADAAKIVIGNDSPLNAYWLVNQSGFDRALPTAAVRNGFEVLREYVDAKGRPVAKVRTGDEIEVRLRLRAIDGAKPVADAAVVDLLPGGFDVVVDRPAAPDAEAGATPQDKPAEYRPAIAGAGTTWWPEYADVREDRVVLYGTVRGDVAEFRYRIKATTAGRYTVPPTFGESMYDRSVQARSLGGSITVEP